MEFSPFVFSAAKCFESATWGVYRAVITSKGHKKSLNRKLAIFFAILLMWLFGGVCLGLMHSADHWNFLLLGGYDIGTLGQIGGYYLARFGLQVPALGFAAFIISRSDFRHPVRTAYFTVLGYYGTMMTIRLVRNPWAVAPDLAQSIPVLAELAQLVLMLVFIGLCTRFVIWFTAWLETGPFARYARP